VRSKIVRTTPPDPLTAELPEAPFTEVAAESVPAGSAPESRRAIVRLDRLFVPAPPLRIGVRNVSVALAGVIAATIISLTRVRGHGVFDSVFGEDGSLFLNDAWVMDLPHALPRSYNGYIHVVPRLLAEVAAAFPPAWAPGVMSLEASLLGSLLALVVFLASAGHFRDPLPRLLISVPVAVTYTAPGLVDNNIATVQFPALYALFWVLLWVPAGRWGRVVAIVVALGTALGSVLPVVFLPLAAVRVFTRRDRQSLVLVATFTAGLSVQLLGLVTGVFSRAGVSQPRPDPTWIMKEYLATAVPRTILGEAWLKPPYPHYREHLALLGLAWLVVFTAALVAVTKRTDPATALALLAGGHSVLLFGLQIAAHGSVPSRYVAAPALLVLTAVTALLRPHDRQGRPGLWPVVSLATLIAVACVANLRTDTDRSRNPSWRGTLSRAAIQCRTHTFPPMPSSASGRNGRNAYVDFAGPGWTIHVPCRKLGL
jgi:hypothetical protein